MTNFEDDLAFSKEAARSRSDEATIMQMLDGCVSVKKANGHLDLAGIDYIATLRGGAQVYVDAKTRKPGCSKGWKGDAEVAIEKWSKMPGGKYNRPRSLSQAGWTLDESKRTHLILYIWPKEDWPLAYLFPFQHLRMAAKRNMKSWEEYYDLRTQESNGQWQSQHMTVPVSVVQLAIESTWTGQAIHMPKSLPEQKLLL